MVKFRLDSQVTHFFKEKNKTKPKHAYACTHPPTHPALVMLTLGQLKVKHVVDLLDLCASLDTLQLVSEFSQFDVEVDFVLSTRELGATSTGWRHQKQSLQRRNKLLSQVFRMKYQLLLSITLAVLNFLVVYIDFLWYQYVDHITSNTKYKGLHIQFRVSSYNYKFKPLWTTY